MSPVAIAYAATHPEVSELILCEAMASIATGWLGPILRSQIGLEMVEEEAGEPVFTIWERVGPQDEVARLLKVVRDSDGRYPAGLVEVVQLEWDAESSLAEISIPTLILTTRNTALVDSLPDARHLAAGITGSHLVGLDGDDRSGAPYWTDRTATLHAIDGFLRPEEATVESMPGVFRAVVFTDIVESTEYVRRVGDEKGRATVRELEQVVSSLAKANEGRVVKNLGDGSLVSFGSNSSAISFALALQDNSFDGPLQLRVGMAAGEPIQEEGDIHGTVVAQASRIAALGEPGEVIVSDAVCQLAVGKGFNFEPLGEVSLKGFDQPQNVWKVTPTPHP